MKIRQLILILAIASAGFANAEPPPKPKGPPPGGRTGGPGGDSDEMNALLKSFNLTAEQQAKYDAAKKATGDAMRKIHEGKVNGTLSQTEVLKQALASHKAFNAAVQDILTPEQYEKWLPLREADHHKIAQAHKARDEADAKQKADSGKNP
jgi:hypothetical protein